MATAEKDKIAQEFSDKQEEKTLAARQAWRRLLVPAVGSAAFFASAIVGFIKTYKQYGFPSNAFKPFDYGLMSIPFIIVGMAFLYQAEEEAIANGEGEV